MLPRRHGLLALLFLAACPADNKDLLYEPVPVEPHGVKIAADAEGNAKTPAHVSVFLQRGVLEVKGAGRHTLEGMATGAAGDAPPRLDVMQDRVALTQGALGGNPPGGDAKFTLALGETPMALEIDTGRGEAQTVDVGGVPLVKARFHTATGHLTIDWSAPNPQPGASLVFETDGGYVDVSHLARCGASSVSVSSHAGLVNLDLGDLEGAPNAAPPLAIVATVVSGTFVLKVPPRVAALATVEAPAGAVTAKGWRAGEGAGSFAAGPPGASSRVTLQVTAKGGHVELRTD